MPLGMEAGLSPGDFALDVNPPPDQEGGGAPLQLSAHDYCGQKAAWIKMPLGTEVGLGPGNFVLVGDPTPSPKRGRSPLPIFGPCLLWPNGWIDHDGTWHGSGPWSRPHCQMETQLLSPQKVGRAPNFRPMFSVAKRLDASRYHMVRR